MCVYIYIVERYRDCAVNVSSLLRLSSIDALIVVNRRRIDNKVETATIHVATSDNEELRTENVGNETRKWKLRANSVRGRIFIARVKYTRFNSASRCMCRVMYFYFEYLCRVNVTLGVLSSPRLGIRSNASNTSRESKMRHAEGEK